MMPALVRVSVVCFSVVLLNARKACVCARAFVGAWGARAGECALGLGVVPSHAASSLDASVFSLLISRHSSSSSNSRWALPFLSARGPQRMGIDGRWLLTAAARRSFLCLWALESWWQALALAGPVLIGLWTGSDLAGSNVGCLVDRVSNLELTKW